VVDPSTLPLMLGGSIELDVIVHGHEKWEWFS
jgi:hypothetical protein